MERPAAVVVDAGPLFASIDRADRDHAACVSLLESLPGPLIVPVLAIAEVTHLIGRWLQPEAEVRFLSDLASGTYWIETVHPADWIRVAELVWRYRDVALGTVDASVIAAAERLRITTVLTLDRRHFGVVRPVHVSAFELLP